MKTKEICDVLWEEASFKTYYSKDSLLESRTNAKTANRAIALFEAIERLEKMENIIKKTMNSGYFDMPCTFCQHRPCNFRKCEFQLKEWK